MGGGHHKKICTGEVDPFTVAQNNAPLCSNAPTAITPFTPVYYAVTLVNPTGTWNAQLQEQYPAGFHFVGVVCTAFATSAVAAGVNAGQILAVTAPAAGTPIDGVILQQDQTVVCIISGWFDNPGANVSNIVTAIDKGGAGQTNPATKNDTVSPTPILPNDLSILKTVTFPPPSPLDISAAPKIAHYKIVITNNGPIIYNFGSMFELIDQLSVPPAGVPLIASLSGPVLCANSASSNPLDCPVASPSSPSIVVPSSSPVPFLTWRFTSATMNLAPNATITIEYDIEIRRHQDVECVKAPGSDALNNKAFFRLTLPNGTTISEAVNGNNTSPNSSTNLPLSNVPVNTGFYNVDPDCGMIADPLPGPIAMTKRLVTPIPAGGTFPWGTPIVYNINFTNISANSIVVRLRDYFQRLDGPSFDATVTGWSCTPPVACAPPPVVSATQNYPWYYARKKMWDGNVKVAGGATVDVQITINAHHPSCASYEPKSTKNVRNQAVGTYVTAQTTHVLVAAVDVLMAKPDDTCNFVVTKTTPTPNKIEFGQQIHYQVSYRNADTASHNIGTLIDAVRIVNSGYATQLPFTYSYKCFTNSVGSVVAGTGPVPTVLSGSGTAVNTTVPSQGARIIQLPSGKFIKFAAGATLTCDVFLTFQRPPDGDRYCMSEGEPQLENMALMDESLYYNSNLWPATAGYSGTSPLPASQPSPQNKNWATVTTALPRCYKLVIDKSVWPLTTWTGGGPLSYSITLHNYGGNLTGSMGANGFWNGPLLSDAFAQGLFGGGSSIINPPTLPVMTTSCPAGTAGAPTAAWSAAPHTLFSYLQISNFPAGCEITLTYELPGPYRPGQICNTARTGSYWGSNDWYPNSTGGMTSQVCVTVLPVNSLTVRKTEVNNTPGNAPLGPFPFTVSCNNNTLVTSPQGPNPPSHYTLTRNFSLNNGASETIDNIPVGTACTVTEGALPALSPGLCHAPAVPQWTTSYAPSQNVVIPAPGSVPVVNVTNRADCVTGPGAGLKITKSVTNMSTNHVLPNPLPTFPVTVNCTTAGPNTIVPLNAGGAPTSLGNIPVGSDCTITEATPPVPLSYPQYCKWVPSLIIDSVPRPNGFKIVNIQAQPNPHEIEVHNDFVCDRLHGSLTIAKTVAVSGQQNFASATFQVDVTCTPFGGLPSTQTVNLTSPDYRYTVVQIPINSVCKIVENPAPAPLSTFPQGCSWLTTYPLGQELTVYANDYTLIVRNEEVCNLSVDKAWVQVVKAAFVNGVPNTLGQSFSMVGTCTNAAGVATNQPFSLDAANSGATVGVLFGNTCSVQETPAPTVPAPYDAWNCKWVTTYLSNNGGGWSGASTVPVTVLVQNSTTVYELTVRNDLVCPRPALLKPVAAPGRRDGERRPNPR